MCCSVRGSAPAPYSTLQGEHTDTLAENRTIGAPRRSATSGATSCGPLPACTRGRPGNHSRAGVCRPISAPACISRAGPRRAHTRAQHVRTSRSEPCGGLGCAAAGNPPADAPRAQTSSRGHPKTLRARHRRPAPHAVIVSQPCAHCPAVFAWRVLVRVHIARRTTERSRPWRRRESQS